MGGGIRFGISVTPQAALEQELLDNVRLAEGLGYELVGIQDHPYHRRFLDTWSLIAWLAAKTDRITFFPDVANVPLRQPAMLAKAAATLDLLSGGRIELGLGAGGFWDAIVAMGGPRRTPGESVDALAEAIQVIRLAWSSERSVRFSGTYYSLHGFHPGPQPAHPIGIWIGAYRPRMLNLIGRLADGWVPSLGYVTDEDLVRAGELIDAGAREADRDPGAIRRIVNIGGWIGDDEGGGPINGPPEKWVRRMTTLATRAPMDTFIFWSDDASQIELFAKAIIPGDRANCLSARAECCRAAGPVTLAACRAAAAANESARSAFAGAR